MSAFEKPFPVMEDMTVKMVGDYLKVKTSIIIPIGVTEQHGHHLPLSTDSLRATKIGKIIGERTQTLVAPTITQSYSGGGCPGTININPATMSLVISDMLLSLVTQGFNKFYLFVCHGGSENFRALDNSLKMLLRSNPSFDNVLIAVMPSSKFDADNVCRAKAFKEGDWHAGWVETSEIMYLAPELVRMQDFKTDSPELLELMTTHPDNYQCAEKIVDDDCVVARLSQREDVKVGVMGFPERASVETGEKIVASVVRGVSEKIKFLEEKYDGVYKKIKFVPEPIWFIEGGEKPPEKK